MKSSKKALAFALAAAMVVTAVPVAPAEAASTAKLSAKSVTVAAGTAKKQSKTIKVTTPSTWKSVKVSAKSNATGTAKVSVSGKTVKVTAVKKGTAKVTVTVTAKKSGKKVSKKLTATAKVVNAGLKVTAPTEVVVGSETKLTSKVCPSVAKVTYKSSDDTIATVDENGTVKAVKAGDVTITATSDYGKTVEKKISVKNYVLKEVKQTKYNTLEAVIEGNTKDIKAADVKITNKANNNVVAVQNVTPDATDATKVTITTFASLTDGATYVVTLDGVSKEITVSDGVVADVAVSPLQITADTEGTVIKAQLVDKNGIVINEFATDKKPNNVDFTLSTTQGYVGSKDGANKLVLPIAGNKGTAEVTYHTYKFENNQEVGAISKKFEIVAVASTPATISGYNYTIGTSTPDWDKVKATNTFSLSDDVKAYFNFVDSNKKGVTDQYSVASSDPSFLLLPETKLTNNATGVKLVAVKAGSVYINVLKDGKVVTSLPVVITDARKLANITLDVSAVTVANNTGALGADVNVKALDQTGSPITLDSLTAAAVGTKESVGGTSSDGKKLPISAVGAKTGTYTVKIEAKKGNVTLDRYITVNVVTTEKTLADATDLRLSVSASEIDLAIADDAVNTDKKVKVSVAAYDKNAKLGDVELTSVKLGNDAITVGTGATSADIDVAGKSAGTYTITVVAKGKTFTANVVVKNTQAAATVKVINSEYKGNVTDGSSAAGMLKSKDSSGKDIVEFYYNGKQIDSKDTSFEVTVADDQVKVNGSQVYIGTAKVQIKNSKGTKYFVDATVNTVFTLTK